jgi:hypothetical protein
VTAALDLPFAFQMYGTSHTKFWITPNGQLGFGSTPGGSAFGPDGSPRFGGVDGGNCSGRFLDGVGISG